MLTVRISSFIRFTLFIMDTCKYRSRQEMKSSRANFTSTWFAISDTCDNRFSKKIMKLNSSTTCWTNTWLKRDFKSRNSKRKERPTINHLKPTSIIHLCHTGTIIRATSQSLLKILYKLAAPNTSSVNSQIQISINKFKRRLENKRRL